MKAIMCYTPPCDATAYSIGKVLCEFALEQFDNHFKSKQYPRLYAFLLARYLDCFEFRTLADDKDEVSAINQKIHLYFECFDHFHAYLESIKPLTSLSKFPGATYRMRPVRSISEILEQSFDGDQNYGETNPLDLVVIQKRQNELQTEHVIIDNSFFFEEGVISMIDAFNHIFFIGEHFVHVTKMYQISHQCFDHIIESELLYSVYERKKDTYNRTMPAICPTVLFVINLVGLMIRNNNISINKLETIIGKLCYTLLLIDNIGMDTDERVALDCGAYIGASHIIRAWRIASAFYLFRKFDINLFIQCISIKLLQSRKEHSKLQPAYKESLFSDHQELSAGYFILGDCDKSMEHLKLALKFFENTFVSEKRTYMSKKMSNLMSSKDSTINCKSTTQQNRYTLLYQDVREREWLIEDKNSVILIENETYFTMLSNLASIKECNWIKCQKKSKKLRRCSKCRSVYYCSKLCQKKDWKFCVKGQISHRNCCKFMEKRDLSMTLLRK